MRLIATREVVQNAAAAIAAEGEHPTSRTVRARIGGGSLATIQRHLKDWRGDGDFPGEGAVPDAEPPGHIAEQLTAISTDIASLRSDMRGTVEGSGDRADYENIIVEVVEAAVDRLEARVDGLETRLPIVASGLDADAPANGAAGASANGRTPGHPADGENLSGSGLGAMLEALSSSVGTLMENVANVERAVEGRLSSRIEVQLEAIVGDLAPKLNDLLGLTQDLQAAARATETQGVETRADLHALVLSRDHALERLTQIDRGLATFKSDLEKSIAERVDSLHPSAVLAGVESVRADSIEAATSIKTVLRTLSANIEALDERLGDRAEAMAELIEALRADTTRALDASTSDGDAAFRDAEAGPDAGHKRFDALFGILERIERARTVERDDISAALAECVAIANTEFETLRAKAESAFPAHLDASAPADILGAVSAVRATSETLLDASASGFERLAGDITALDRRLAGQETAIQSAMEGLRSKIAGLVEEKAQAAEQADPTGEIVTPIAERPDQRHAELSDILSRMEALRAADAGELSTTLAAFTQATQSLHDNLSAALTRFDSIEETRLRDDDASQRAAIDRSMAGIDSAVGALTAATEAATRRLAESDAARDMSSDRADEALIAEIDRVRSEIAHLRETQQRDRSQLKAEEFAAALAKVADTVTALRNEETQGRAALLEALSLQSPEDAAHAAAQIAAADHAAATRHGEVVALLTEILALADRGKEPTEQDRTAATLLRAETASIAATEASRQTMTLIKQIEGMLGSRLADSSVAEAAFEALASELSALKAAMRSQPSVPQSDGTAIDEVNSPDIGHDVRALIARIGDRLESAISDQHTISANTQRILAEIGESGSVGHLSASDVLSVETTPSSQPALSDVEARDDPVPVDVIAAGRLNLPMPFTLQALEGVAYGRLKLGLTDAAIQKVESSKRFAARSAEMSTVYGVTTGFGPLARYRIDASDRENLQWGLLAHLATGVGRPMPRHEARAMVAIRFATLARGLSGASPGLVAAIGDYLNAGLSPIVPEKGTVGASGDLTPLSHALLSIVGEAGSLTREGTLTDGDNFAVLGLECPEFDLRDGLAFVNGTAMMTGVLGLTLRRVEHLLNAAIMTVAAFGEAVGARAEAWSPALADAAGHRGHRAVADSLAYWAHGGTYRRTKDEDDISPVSAEAPQDVYSLRCAPQILGACHDVVQQAIHTVERDLNGVADNPVFFEEWGEVLHGGNFMGQPVSFAADQTKMVAIQIGNLIERLIAFVSDPNRPNAFKAFLTGGKPGLNSGFMGAQVTATALIAEMRSRGAMMSIQTLSTNGGNQDIVSMGSIAARQCRDVVEDLSSIVAIAALMVAQAIDLQNDLGQKCSSRAARILHMFVRDRSDLLLEDRPLADDIAVIATDIASGQLGAVLENCREIYSRV